MKLIVTQLGRPKSATLVESAAALRKVRSTHAPLVIYPADDASALKAVPFDVLQSLLGPTPHARRRSRTRHQRGVIGKLARKMLRSGKEQDDVLSAIHRKYPWSKAGPRDVRHYASQVKHARH